MIMIIKIDDDDDDDDDDDGMDYSLSFRIKDISKGYFADLHGK